MAELTGNLGMEFEDLKPMLDHVTIEMPAMKNIIEKRHSHIRIDETAQIDSLLKAVTCIDLTTLCGDDTECNVKNLCHKAKNPLQQSLLDSLGINYEEFHIAAVCVYPARISNCVETLTNINADVKVAAVAAGFPSAQYFLSTKLKEIELCVLNGANEIDIVISRDLVLEGKFKELYDEVKAMKNVCGSSVTLKTIIAAGELGSLENVYKASLICMAAGSDFIKTSTGKEAVNATLLIAKTMAQAIKEYYNKTGFEVGFKPAGGIRTVKDVLLFQDLIKKELGSKWMHPHLFRIGASGLLRDIERKIFEHVTGYAPANHLFTY
ncbi:deoxyribose-phosphate aldolase [Caerostris extrusa]|uniref:deoxyribose-phosphate aldolase n=1 Tax=Caerostris extrusa TaxID=172846 RepID=A0AAV4WUF3_CAEEX|nr:deoxyribose-phosphate aldolase [Caerostris extrusa]